MTPEPWLRGPVAGVHPAIQPLLFSFTQIREDLRHHTAGLSNQDVWKPASGGGTLGFHLRHIAGSVERLTGYVFGEQLSEKQLAQLKTESEPRGTLEELLIGIDTALAASENRVRIPRSRRAGRAPLCRAQDAAYHRLRPLGPHR